MTGSGLPALAAAVSGTLCAVLAGFLGRRPAIRAHIGPVAASLGLLGIGAVIRLFLADAFSDAGWHAFSRIIPGFALGASAVALFARAHRDLYVIFASCAGALVATIVIGAASPDVANRVDAVALPVWTAIAGLVATLIAIVAARLPEHWNRVLTAGVFLAAAFWITTRLDPVLVGPDGSPLPAHGPFVAVCAATLAGLGIAVTERSSPGGRWVATTPPLMLGAATVIAYGAAGLYGVALSAVAIFAAAMGKGFAIGSAALTAVGLVAAWLAAAGPRIGVLLGATLITLLSDLRLVRAR